MIDTIFGKKKVMSHKYVGDTRVSVTQVETGPCIVTQVKNHDKDGYFAVQLGFGTKKIKNVTKSLQGHLKSAIVDKKAPSTLREIRFDTDPGLKVGDKVVVSDIFKKGDVVEVTGTSKGKGFQGVVKRWHFAGGPKTHGQSDRHRSPGSIGQGTTPGRVHKNKKMAGRMGGDTKTIKNLVVIDIFDNNLLISGSLPGSRNSFLRIKKIKSGALSDLEEEVPAVVAQVEEVEETKSETTEEVKSEDKAE